MAGDFSLAAPTLHSDDLVALSRIQVLFAMTKLYRSFRTPVKKFHNFCPTVRHISLGRIRKSEQSAL